MTYSILIECIGGLDHGKSWKFSATQGLIIQIGRDPVTNDVVVNHDEDVVSRRHATISVEFVSDCPELSLLDVGANGTIVNGSSIKSRTEIFSSDIFQLGGAGPSFKILVDPAPIKATRILQVAKDPKATRIVKTAISYRESVPKRESLPDESSRRSKSDRLNFETSLNVHGPSTDRSDVEVEGKNRKFLSSWALVVAAALVAISGIFFFFKSKSSDDQVRPALDAKELVERWSSSVARIEGNWRVYEKGTSNVAYIQGHILFGEKFPLYKEGSNGEVLPVITFDKQKAFAPLGGTTNGSGFLVAENGLLMTVRKVAEPWSGKTTLPFPGVLRRLNGDLDRVNDSVRPEGWISSRDQYFDDKGTLASGLLDGRFTDINVVFSGSSIRINARNASSSNISSLALLKIDAGKSFKAVQFSDSPDGARTGERVLLLGFPSSSKLKSSLDANSAKQNSGEQDAISVQNVALLNGVVSQAALGSEVLKNQGVPTDSFEIGLPVHNSGFTGGPLFDPSGRVIGIYSGSAGDGGSNVQGAISIAARHAGDLMMSK